MESLLLVLPTNHPDVLLDPLLEYRLRNLRLFRLCNLQFPVCLTDNPRTIAQNSLLLLLHRYRLAFRPPIRLLNRHVHQAPFLLCIQHGARQLNLLIRLRLSLVIARLRSRSPSRPYARLLLRRPSLRRQLLFRLCASPVLVHRCVLYLVTQQYQCDLLLHLLADCLHRALPLHNLPHGRLRNQSAVRPVNRPDDPVGSRLVNPRLPQHSLLQVQAPRALTMELFRRKTYFRFPRYRQDFGYHCFFSEQCRELPRLSRTFHLPPGLAMEIITLSLAPQSLKASCN